MSSPLPLKGCGASTAPTAMRSRAHSSICSPNIAALRAEYIQAQCRNNGLLGMELNPSRGGSFLTVDDDDDVGSSPADEALIKQEDVAL